jgi:hypothetical protein
MSYGPLRNILARNDAMCCVQRNAAGGPVALSQQSFHKTAKEKCASEQEERSKPGRLLGT